jgi:hypothetical protein
VSLTPKVRKTLDLAIRFIIAVFSLSYIFYRVYTLPAGQVNAFFNSLLSDKQLISLSIALIVFMVINWGVESWKWKLLINQSERISILTAYQAVLGGLAVSIFTPNRVGEFMGRVFILRKTDPLKATLLTVVGSFSQLVVTIAIGTVAYVGFAPRYLRSIINDSTWLINGFSISLVTLSLIMLFAFFNISVLNRISILFPLKYSDTIKNSINAIADCPKRLLAKVMLLSTFRYLVFLLQFYIAIRLMGLGFTILQCAMVIPVIFLTLASIPTIALSEIGVRGSVSVFLFGLISGNEALNPGAALAVISASTLVWLINIALPSLVGVLVIFRLNFFVR